MKFNSLSVSKIELTSEQQDIVEKIMNGEPIQSTTRIRNVNGTEREYTIRRPLSRDASKKKLSQIYGGRKCGCSQWPAYRIVYDVSDEKQAAKRIERLCQKCYDKIKGDLQLEEKTMLEL